MSATQKILELNAFSGKLIALVDLEADAVRPVRAREIAHVRAVAPPPGE